MKIEKPEYLGLMFLHAARWELQKILKAPFSAKAVRDLRPYLPYSIITGDNLPGTTNRSYNALGVPGPARYNFGKWSNSPTFHLPKNKCRLWTRDREQTWLFNDGNPPWRDREAAEEYLQTLDNYFDFSLEDLAA